MLRRSLMTTAAIPLAAALALSGCSGEGAGGDETASAAPTDSAEASASADPTDSASADPSADSTDAPTDGAETAAGDLHVAAGALAEGFPEIIPVLDGAEIVRSSWETPGEDELERFSLVLRTDMSEDDILKAYQEGLDAHDFKPVGEASSSDGVTSLTFQKDSGAQLVTVSVSADPDGGDGRLVSVGGQVKP